MKNLYLLSGIAFLYALLFSCAGAPSGSTVSPAPEAAEGQETAAEETQEAKTVVLWQPETLVYSYVDGTQLTPTFRITTGLFLTLAKQKNDFLNFK